MEDTDNTIGRINRFVQSISVLGLDIGEATAQEQGCDPGSEFAFLDLQNHTNYAAHYYRQKLESCRHMTKFQDQQFGNRIKHFVASKADLIFKLRGKERLRSGIDYNVDGTQEVYSVYATQVPPIENGMQLSNVARRAQIFEILKVGDIILGKVVGKRPFGVFVRILSLVHGRNLDFHNIDIQALCPKSELEKDRKSREHLDPIDDFDVDDTVQGVICSLSKDEERIAISFRSAKLPSEYGDIELGIVEDIEEHKLRAKSFDDNVDYNECLRRDPGFSNPANVQTLIDVLGIDSRPPSSLLRSCQRWTFSDKEPDSLRKQQSKKWSMDTTAIGVESFKNGDHGKALKYLNHALKIYEENSEALVARGALYANQDKLEYAIKDFKQALKLHPKHYNASKYLKETLFEKGLRLKDVGNLREAITIFEDVLKTDPDSTESQITLKELKALLSVKLVEEEEKARMAASLLQENRKKFEHVRKLIKSDPDVVKSNRKKKRKKRKKGKKVKKKKQRRRSESETTSTASETGSHYCDADEWVEIDLKKRSPRKNENVVPGLRDEGQAMSSIGPETSECTTTGMNVLNLNSDNNVSAAIVRDTRKSSERRLSELSESNIVRRGGDGERNLRGGVKAVGERDEGEAEVGVRDKGKEEIKEIGNDNINISGPDRRECSRRHRSRSRSKSRSLEKKDGTLMRRSGPKDLSARKKSRKNLNESDTDSGERKGSKNFQDTSSDSSARNSSRSRRNSLKRDRLRIIRGRRSASKGSRGRRSTSRDSRGRRGSSRDSSERNGSRSRSNSLERDRSGIIRGRKGTSQGSRGLRSTSRGNSDGRNRSRSRSNDLERYRSKRGRIRRQRSTSRSSKGRRSTSRNNRERRSTSMDKRGRRSTSRGMQNESSELK